MLRVWVLVAAWIVLGNANQLAWGQQGFANDPSGRNYQTSPTSELGPFDTYAPSNGTFPGPNQLNPELMPSNYPGGYPMYQSAYSKFSLNNQRYSTGYRGYVNEFGGYSPYAIQPGWNVPWGAPPVYRYYRGGHPITCDCDVVPGTVIYESSNTVPQEVLRLPDPTPATTEPQSLDIDAPALPQSNDVVFPIDDFST